MRRSGRSEVYSVLLALAAVATVMLLLYETVFLQSTHLYLDPIAAASRRVFVLNTENISRQEPSPPIQLFDNGDDEEEPEDPWAAGEAEDKKYQEYKAAKAQEGVPAVNTDTAAAATPASSSMQRLLNLKRASRDASDGVEAQNAIQGASLASQSIPQQVNAAQAGAPSAAPIPSAAAPAGDALRSGDPIPKINFDQRMKYVAKRIFNKEGCYDWMEKLHVRDHRGLCGGEHRAKFWVCPVNEPDCAQPRVLKVHPQGAMKSLHRDYALEEMRLGLVLHALDAPHSGVYDSALPHIVPLETAWNDCPRVPLRWFGKLKEADRYPTHPQDLDEKCWWAAEPDGTRSPTGLGLLTAATTPLMEGNMDRLAGRLRKQAPITKMTPDTLAVRGHQYKALFFQLIMTFITGEHAVELYNFDFKSSHIIYERYKTAPKELWRYQLGTDTYYVDAAAAEGISLRLIDFHLAYSVFRGRMAGDTWKWAQTPLTDVWMLPPEQQKNYEQAGKGAIPPEDNKKTRPAPTAWYTIYNGNTRVVGTSIQFALKATKQIEAVPDPDDGAPLVEKLRNLVDTMGKSKDHTTPRKGRPFVDFDIPKEDRLVWYLREHPIFAQFRTIPAQYLKPGVKAPAFRSTPLQLPTDDEVADAIAQERKLLQDDVVVRSFGYNSYEQLQKLMQAAVETNIDLFR